MTDRYTKRLSTMKHKRKGNIIDRIVRRVFYKNYARNLYYELQLRARRSSADYVENHMQDAVIFWRLSEMLEYCLEQAHTDGLLLEFGVAGGNSINIIAEIACDREVHGFDSFEGLPKDWTGHIETKGAFSRNGKLPEVRSNVRLYKGWFSDSLPEFLAENAGPVAFLHIDCDLYSSTRDVLWQLAERLRPGTIIEFDEYFNYHNWQKHEFRAWQEFVDEFSINYSYIAMTASGGSVAVKITDISKKQHDVY
jgi:hypothetical protein